MTTTDSSEKRLEKICNELIDHCYDKITQDGKLDELDIPVAFEFYANCLSNILGNLFWRIVGDCGDTEEECRQLANAIFPKMCAHAAACIAAHLESIHSCDKCTKTVH